MSHHNNNMAASCLHGNGAWWNVGMCELLLPFGSGRSQSKDDKFARILSFGAFYIGFSGVVMLILTILWIQHKARNDQNQKQGYAQIANAKVANVDHYVKADVLFVAYHISYVYAAIGLGLYAGLSGKFYGSTQWPEPEFYAPFLLEASFTVLIVAFTSVIGDRSRGLPCWPASFVTAILPFGERFDLLRDSMALAVYVQGRTSVSAVCATLSVISCVVPPWIAYQSSNEVLLMRATFWPVGALDIEESLDKYSDEKIWPSGDPDVAFFSAGREAATSGFGGTLKAGAQATLLFVLKLLYNATSSNKQLWIFYEQIPQAVIGIIFMTSDGLHSTILLSLAIIVFQAILLFLLRPFVMCWQARASKPWEAVTSWDIQRAVACSAWSPRPCCFALAWLLTGGCTPPDVMLEAARLLGEQAAKAEEDAPVRKLVAYVQDSLLTSKAREVFLRLADISLVKIKDRETTVPHSKSHDWQMVGAILKHSLEANVNFCNLKAHDLHSMLEAGRLPLQYLNINDNKELCKERVGVDAVLKLLELSPDLSELKLARVGLSEESMAEIRKAWLPRPEAGLRLE